MNLWMRENIVQAAECFTQQPHRTFLIQILSSWFNGKGCMPQYLGLESEEFDQMIQTYLGPLDYQFLIQKREVFNEDRCPEREDLRTFLQGHVGPQDYTAKWFIEILIAGMMGSNHLWEDLGLFTRATLRQFMESVFPTLAAQNVNQMRWKKFIYKQLCIAEGFTYVCRSPSCDVCPEYSLCFDTDEETQ